MCFLLHIAPMPPRVGVLVLVGLGLRLWGISFGLPFVFPPDERPVSWSRSP